MSEIMEKFPIFSKISAKLKEQIKLFHVFYDSKEYSVLFITSDDKVYGFGSNQFGCCGFGHNTAVVEPQIIHELCHKNIRQFIIGKDYILANSLDHIYGWGISNLGQLGFMNRFEISKPRLIFDEKGVHIIDISCGASHCLVLTSDAKVYGWGNNEHGQLGIRGKQIKNVQELENLSRIKVTSVHCINDRSYALTNDGKTYSWGSNSGFALGYHSKNKFISEPTLISLSNVISICMSKANTYFLTTDGFIHFCGKFINEKKTSAYHKTPQLIKKDIKFTQLLTIPYYQKRGHIPIALNDKGVYIMYLDDFKEESHKNLIDLIALNYKITYKSIDNLEENNRQFNELSSFYDESDLVGEDLFHGRFNPIQEIGSGGFGTVFKAKYKASGKWFAVKKIQYDDSDEEVLLKEVKTLMHCDKKYVVEYIDWWKCDISKTLFIQMELCSDNLANIIEQKAAHFDREPGNSINILEYYFSCEVFKEILQCIQSLHESDPPIIHRDIKPENILINEMPKNNRFIKICDFGLATYDSKTTVTLTQGPGTPKYIAPEVLNATDGKCRYTIKADIWSLSIVAQQLFDIDLQNLNLGDVSLTDNHQIEVNWTALVHQLERMYKTMYKERPTCSDLLECSYEWGIEHGDLITNEFHLYLRKMRNELDNFFSRFILSKVKSNFFHLKTNYMSI